MLEKIYVVYDNSLKPCYDVENIIGDKSFGEVIFKRRTLKDRYFEVLNKYEFIKGILDINSVSTIKKVFNEVSEFPTTTKIIHLYSEYIIKCEESFDTIIKKSQYIKESIIINSNEGIIGLMFDNTEEYMRFLKSCVSMKETKKPCEEVTYQTMLSNAFFQLNDLSNFLQYITGGFDARFFNSLNGDEYTVTKSSTNKKKIKSEYMFYHLLPDEMKYWFVLPYDYQETEEIASYTMERLHMTDIAIRWVHNAISTEEFRKLLKKIFYFVDSRKRKIISRDEYIKISNSLYLDKIDERIDDLKRHDLFSCFADYIKSSTNYSNIEEIVMEYKNLYRSVVEEVDIEYISVIGHGDLCFSNMLYNKETSTLKLIDTKGALEEEQIWTNPYYDIAKLSHSICGKYDFFNSGMYDIKLNSDLKFELTIDFDNSAYIEIFREYLEKSGYDYRMIRLLEASLFLSMMPLHMDFPQKVFGFLLNAINILEEVKNV
ncbi:hypothetical protein GKZ28_04025 [Clostridium chromiireducens]|uniref:Uncharacterized protein n=1 Tax=Clostridium chromiireducens TaxID=225345 RepID=A0A964RJP7_9CLOT|nr:hypothetical protein [Clostridium chromiireducens]MVX62870.1 hypothetical protein [Clostridium chromiireducens]